MRISQTILVLILVAGSRCAIAGDYSDAVNKHSKCEAAGELAKSFYGLSNEKFKEAVNDIGREEKEKKISKKMSVDTQYIIFMGNSAKSPKDAYLRAWAWCMDQK